MKWNEEFYAKYYSFATAKIETCAKRFLKFFGIEKKLYLCNIIPGVE